MAVDPNETARQAFGQEPMPPAPVAPRYTGPAPSTPPVCDFADWWTRAGAFLLDQLIVASIAVVAALMAILFTGDPEGRTAEIVVYAVAVTVSVLYAPLLMRRGGERNGQTFGKRAVGIRVVRTSGEPLTFWTGFLRTVIAQQLLTAITFYVYALFDYLWPLRDPQNQALHDKIAKTWVMRSVATPASASHAPPYSPPAPAPVDEAPIQGWLPPSAGA